MTTKPTALVAASTLALLTCMMACGPAEETMTPEAPGVSAPSMDPVAESYVKLVLAVGQHDAGYVDAYYGPEEYKQEVADEALSLEQIRARAQELLEELPPPQAVAGDEMLRLRRSFLSAQLGALIAHVDRLGGKEMTFDEESKALYGAVAPHHDDEHYEAILKDMEDLLPGSGPLASRLEEFKKDFIIPPDKLDTVFRGAIGACQARTEERMELPPGESFTIEYVTDKPWSGYNWYQGNFQSLIQVNTDLPTYIDRALDLACHEGYPGHHVYNSLLEWRLSVERGWVENTVYPLYSPQSLIAEGTANYGIDISFPGDRRAEFEKMNLFPLAGLDPNKAELYYEVMDNMDRLAYASNEAARLYRDGEIDAGEAADRLVKYSLMTPERAEQRVRFIDNYGAYVINYNLGKDMVARYVEHEAGRDMLKRWEVFTELLSTPRLPPDLE